MEAIKVNHTRFPKEDLDQLKVFGSNACHCYQPSVYHDFHHTLTRWRVKIIFDYIYIYIIKIKIKTTKTKVYSTKTLFGKNVIIKTGLDA